MKFSIPIQNDNLGGTIWLRHIVETLKNLGHEVDYCDYDSDTSRADFVIIQSEWIEKPAYKTSNRAIVLLGHFTAVVYPDSTKLREQDIVLTQWKGEVVEDWEKRSGLKAHYFPHGYLPEPYLGGGYDYEGRHAVWIGSETPFRDISRFNDLPIDKVFCSSEEASEYYKFSDICPNVHLNIQKGELVNVPESILTKPGYAVNERLFWICGAGGFQIADENPIIRDFYEDDEVVMATADDFKAKFEYYLNHPEERKAIAKKGQLRTVRDHTYENRIKNILLPLL